ncbi:MAG: hypothetical protein ABSE05_15230, partial [Syntrophales bacterium]
EDPGYGLLQHPTAETGCSMNINPEQFPTYKSLSPVLRNQTTCVNRKSGHLINSLLFSDNFYWQFSRPQ